MVGDWLNIEQLKAMSKHLCGAIAAVLVFSAVHPLLSFLHSLGWIETSVYDTSLKIDGFMLNFTLVLLSIAFTIEIAIGLKKAFLELYSWEEGLRS